MLVSAGLSSEIYRMSVGQQCHVLFFMLKLPGRGPTGLQARGRNRGQLENQSHMVPKTEFQVGGDRTRIFTHKIITLA